MPVTDVEGAAADLLDRLEVCRLAQQGLGEADLHGADVRPPFRTMCSALASTLQRAVGPELAASVQLLAQRVEQAAASQNAAQGGRLDATLTALAKAADADFRSGSRLEVLESLVARLQASRLTAAHHRRKRRKQEQEAQAAAAAKGLAAGAQPAGGGAAAAAQAAALAPADAPRMALELQAIAEALQRLQRRTAIVPSSSGGGGGGLPGGAGAAPPHLQAGLLLERLSRMLGQLPPGFFEPLLQRGSLDPVQASVLGEINAVLRADYAMRRRMLVERLLVTLQSFTWSARLDEKGTRGEVQALVEAVKARLDPEPAVQLEDVYRVTPADVVAATQRVAHSRSAFTASIKGVLIGKVPDRGGRQHDSRAKDAKMPEWAPRQAGDGTSAGAGRGGGGRGRGGHGKGGGGGGGGKGAGSGAAGHQGGRGGGGQEAAAGQGQVQGRGRSQQQQQQQQPGARPASAQQQGGQAGMSGSVQQQGQAQQQPHARPASAQPQQGQQGRGGGGGGHRPGSAQHRGGGGRGRGQGGGRGAG